jgi:hypothetical protein
VAVERPRRCVVKTWTSIVVGAASAGVVVAAYEAGRRKGERCGVDQALDVCSRLERTPVLHEAGQPAEGGKRRMTTRFKFRRPLTLIASALVALGASAVFAAWVVEGTGQGGGQVGSAQPLQVSKAYPTAGVFPGATNGSLAVSVVNPNPTTLTAVKLQITDPTITPESAPAGCTNVATYLTLSGATTRTINVALPSTTPTPIEIPNAITADAAMPIECAGVKFHVGAVKVTTG